MNTRPILDSDTGPFVLSVSFNADCSHFSVALETGFRGMTHACNSRLITDAYSLLGQNMRGEGFQRYFGPVNMPHGILTPP